MLTPTRLRRRPAPADNSPHAKAGRAFQNQVMKQRRRTIITRALLVLVVIVSTLGIVAGFQKPLTIKHLQDQVAGLNKQVATLTAPVFPVDSAITPAQQATAQCAAYTDQASTNAITAVENGCGWNGQGVATPVGLPQFDPDPAHRAPVQNGYTTLPFTVQLMGVPGWMTYYVAIHQTSPTSAAVVGVPTPLNAKPTFVVSGCTSDSTAVNPATDSHVQAVDALVAGEPRYALPGRTLNFNGNGLSRAAASNEQLCAPQGNAQLVLATVTYHGPAAGSQIAVGLAFATTVISTGEVRVSAVGLNTAYTPQN